MKTVKLYYHMNELRYILQVPNHTIRFWCDKFSIEPKRNKKGNRLFSLKEVKRLMKVYELLKVERYTIEGALLFFKRERQEKFSNKKYQNQTT